MNCNKGLRILVTTILLAVTLTVSAQKENLETFADFHHVAAYIVTALLIGLFVMIFTNRLYYYRDKDTRAKGQQLNKQLGLVLYSNKTQIFTYNVQKRLFSILSESGEEWKDMAAIDFSQFFDHDDFKRLRNEFIQPISEGRKENGCMIVRGAKISDKEKIYDIKISILHGSSTCEFRKYFWGYSETSQKSTPGAKTPKSFP